MIPRRLPTVAADRMIAAWQDLGIGELYIPVEMSFDRSLDADRLARALALLYDAEPVTGCRFVRERGGAWERLEDPGALTVSGDEAAYARFRTAFPDIFGGPQITGFLLRRPGGDRLFLHVSHAIADAGGTKHVVASLSSIYRRLGAEPGFAPEPNLRGARGVDQLFRALPLGAHWRVLVNFVREMRSLNFPRYTHAWEPPVVERSPVGFAVKTIPAERVAALAELGRSRGATLNDLLMAAFVRAQIAGAPWDGKRTIRLQTTVDLRRYLPGRKAGGICNLSAFDYFFPGTAPGTDFAETLSLVAARTRARKADWTGITLLALSPVMWALRYGGMTAAMRRMFSDNARDHAQPNVLTNLGPITLETVDFGIRPVDARLLTPPIYPPSFGVGVSGYGGALTLSAGAPAGALPAIEGFLDQIVSGLPE